MRGDYDSEGKACLTLSDLEEQLIKWIVDVYHQTAHRGLGGKTPYEMWTTMEPRQPIHLPADLDSLEAMLAMRETREVHHYGIEIKYGKYNSSELQLLRQRAQDLKSVEVRYRDDMSYVWVQDASNRKFIQVPVTDSRLKGLSRDLVSEARKVLRQAGKNPDDSGSILSATRSIQAAVETAKASNKLRKRRAAAKAGLDKFGNQLPPAPAASPANMILPFDLEDTDIPTFEISDSN